MRRVSGFYVLLCVMGQLYADECRYPVSLPTVTRMSYHPESSVAVVSLDTPYSVESWLFWVTDSEWMGMEELLMQKPAYYPLTGKINGAESVHEVSGTNHTFSVASNRKLAVYSLRLQLDIGCTLIEVSIPLKPNAIQNTKFPHHLGTITKLPPKSQLFEDDQWFDLEIEYEGRFKPLSMKQLVHKSKDEERSDEGKRGDNRYVLSENSGTETSEGVTRVFYKMKMLPGTKAVALYFGMYQKDKTAIGADVTMVTTFYTRVNGFQPILKIEKCVWDTPSMIQSKGRTIIPMEKGSDGCLKITAFGKPTPRVSVSRKNGNEIEKFSTTNKAYPMLQTGYYHLGRVSDQDQDYTIIAANYLGLKSLKFRISGADSFKISAVPPHGSDANGMLHLYCPRMVRFQCEVSGPVEKVYFYKTFDWALPLPQPGFWDVISVQDGKGDGIYHVDVDVTDQVLSELKGMEVQGVSMGGKVLACAAEVKGEFRMAAFKIEVDSE